MFPKDALSSSSSSSKIKQKNAKLKIIKERTCRIIISKNKYKIIKLIKKAYISKVLKIWVSKKFYGAPKQIGFRELFHKKKSKKGNKKKHFLHNVQKN